MSETRTTFSIEKLAEENADACPGYNLVSYFEAGFPVYRVNVRLTLLEEKTIPFVQEFVLKLIEAGVTSGEEIALWLGVDDKHVYEAIGDLLRRDMLMSQPVSGLRLTAKGEQALRTLKLNVPQIASFSFVIDAMTEDYELSVRGIHPKSALRRLGWITLTPYAPKPSLATLRLARLKALMRQFQNERGDQVPKGEVVGLVSVDRVWVEYRLMQVLTYQENHGVDIEFRVFDRHHRMPAHERVLKRLEADGVKVVPSDARGPVKPPSPSTPFALDWVGAEETSQRLSKIRSDEQSIKLQLELHKITAEQADSADEQAEAKLRVSELEERLRQLLSEKAALESQYRVLSTFEHRPLLERAIDEATRSVIIISPWLRRGGLDDDLLAKIEAALKRQVRIYIGYGIDSNEERRQHDTYVLDRLESLREKPYGSNLILKEFGNTHEKLLVCDESFFVVTSFNWLSFRGDPNRPLRQERGFYCGVPEQVSKFYQEQLSRFSDNGRKEE